MQSSRSLRSSSSSIPIDRQRKIPTTNRSKHKQLSSLVKKSQSTSTSDTETALLISNANCNVTHVLCSNPNSYENLLRQDLTFESNRQRIILTVMKYLKPSTLSWIHQWSRFHQFLVFIPVLLFASFMDHLEPNAGLGVFAADFITKGMHICIYHGERIIKDQMLRRTRNTAVGDVTYAFQINTNE
ncbi:hypothetical protein RCL1_008962 [Eukaryota sp. TZLM3-RCL]